MSLIAHFKLDEGSGTTINDSMGPPATGTATGISWTSAPSNLKFVSPNSLQFFGSNDRVDITGVSGEHKLSFADSDLSASFWFYSESGSHITQTILERSEGANAQSGYAIYLTNRPSINYPTRSVQVLVDGNKATTAGAIYNRDEWNHCLITVDTGDFSCFINGSEKPMTFLANSSGVQPPSGNTSTFNIGSLAYTNSGFFDGRLKDIRLYNHVLNKNEREALASGYSHLWEGTGTNWDLGTNWLLQSGVPQNVDAVFLNDFASGNAQLNSNVTIQSLVTEAFNQKLDLNSNSLLCSNNIIWNSGTLDLNSGSITTNELVWKAGSLTGIGTITDSGTLNVEGGTISGQPTYNLYGNIINYKPNNNVLTNTDTFLLGGTGISLDTDFNSLGNLTIKNNVITKLLSALKVENFNVSTGSTFKSNGFNIGIGGAPNFSGTIINNSGLYHLSGIGNQSLDFGTGTVEKIILDGLGTKTFMEDTTCERLEIKKGTIDFNGNTFNILGDFLVSPGVDIVTSGLANTTIAITGISKIKGQSRAEKLQLNPSSEWVLDVRGNTSIVWFADVNNLNSTGITTIIVN